MIISPHPDTLAPAWTDNMLSVSKGIWDCGLASNSRFAQPAWRIGSLPERAQPREYTRNQHRLLGGNKQRKGGTLNVTGQSGFTASGVPSAWSAQSWSTVAPRAESTVVGGRGGSPTFSPRNVSSVTLFPGDIEGRVGGAATIPWPP